MRQQKALAELGGHIFGLRFDPSSQYAVVVGSEKSLSLYDVHAQKLAAKSTPHIGDVYAVGFSPSGRRLVSGGLDGLMTIWTFSPAGTPIPPHQFSPSPQMLAATQRNSISEIRIVGENAAWIHTWDQQQRRFRLHQDKDETAEMDTVQLRDRLVESLDLAKVSAFRISELSPITLWANGTTNLPTELISLQENMDTDKVVASVSRKGELLAVVDNSGGAFVFERRVGLIRMVDIGRKDPRAVALLPKQDLLIVGFLDGDVVGINFRTGQQVFQTRCGDKPVLFLVSDHKRQRVFSLARNGPLCVFGLSGEHAVEQRELLADVLAFSPDEDMLAVAGLTGVITLYNAADLGELVRYDGHRGPVHALHFTLDSEQLVSGGADEIIRRWPAAEARRIALASRVHLKEALKNKRTMPADEAIKPWVSEYSQSFNPK